MMEYVLPTRLPPRTSRIPCSGFFFHSANEEAALRSIASDSLGIEIENECSRRDSNPGNELGRLRS